MPSPSPDPRQRRAFPYGKPWDIGDGDATATFGLDGRLLAFSRAHPSHGWIHLAGFPQFDESQRHDPDAVRAHRRAIGDPLGPGLTLTVIGFGAPSRAWRDPRTPQWRWRGKDVLVTWRPRVVGGVLLLTLAAECKGTPAPPMIEAVFAADLRLMRAAYGQITEGGPLPAPPSPAAVRLEGRAARWRSGPLGAAARLDAVAPDATLVDGLLRWTVRLPLVKGRADVTIRIRLEVEDAPVVRAPRRSRTSVVAAETAPQPRPGSTAWWIARNVAFALDACAVPVGGGTCIITDPILLPLSWTRDAYYVCCLLGRVARSPDERGERAREAIRRHIRWLFTICERPGGSWGRSALTSGRTKDAAIQLDQQWYPLLELARAATDWGMPRLWRAVRDDVHAVIAALDATRDARTGLYPTSETPADDPLDLPFHFSSHVLAWRTLTLLGTLPGAQRFAIEATALRARVEAAFASGRRRPYAYAIDGRGRARAYHDANDLPTACAARWGYCTRDHGPWRATLRFAWSRANPGYFPGRFGGLGSLHAPSPWTLGDVQRWIVARDLGDRSEMAAAERRLRAVAFDDGLLCESYDAATGHPRTRPWFAWPGCAWAAVRLGDSL